MRSLLSPLLTLALSAAGGSVMFLLGVPAGLLMGGALAVTVASVLGVRTSVPTPLRDFIFILVGLSMGANVAPNSLSLMAQWPVTLIALALELAVIVLVIGVMLIKVFDLDRGTAYLSSFPGHLSFIMGISSAGVGDTRQIMVIQVLRVMMLTLFAPIGALFLPVGEFGGQAARALASPTTVLMVAAGCALTGFVFSRFKVPAGFVLGSMAFATTMKLTGHFNGGLHPALVNATFVAMGALIGSRFAGVGPRELARAAVGGGAATLATVAITTLFAFGASLLVDMPMGQLWLGLAPGGLESMGALGIALGYDTAFIAAHHVSRLLILSFAIPAVVFLVRERPPRGAS